MKLRTSLLPMSALAVAIAVSSCGKSSPTAPAVAGPPPTPTIQTPVSATITKIQVTKWPAKTTGGDDWDSSILASARRPDIYVTLSKTTGGDEYVSNTDADVVAGTTLTFTQAVSGSLPDLVHYGTDHRVYVMDEDFGGDDDTMGWITLNLPSAYANDNARFLDHTFTDSANRISVRVVGIWSY